MIRPRDFFQIGLLVGDIESGMRRLSSALGYTFCQPFDMTIRMRQGDLETRAPIRMALTREFPHFKLVETAEDVADGLFGHPGPLYYGSWVDDLQTESDRLVLEGMPLVVQGLDLRTGEPTWAYHRLGDNTMIELLSRRTQSFFRTMIDRSTSPHV